MSDLGVRYIHTSQEQAQAELDRRRLMARERRARKKQRTARDANQESSRSRNEAGFHVRLFRYKEWEDHGGFGAGNS